MIEVALEKIAADLVRHGDYENVTNPNRPTTESFGVGMLRIEIEDDPYYDLRDWADCYGLVQHARIGQQTYRPDGFDGAARKLWVANQCYWWQPPSDIVADSEEMVRMCQAVEYLLEFGVQIVRLEYCEGTDAYHQPIVRNFVSLGHVEWYVPHNDEYRNDIVLGLLGELQAELNLTFVTA